MTFMWHMVLLYTKGGIIMENNPYSQPNLCNSVNVENTNKYNSEWLNLAVHDQENSSTAFKLDDA